MTALHTAHEAGWLNAGQSQAADLSSVVRPGSVVSSILTGVLGLQAVPDRGRGGGLGRVRRAAARARLAWPQRRRPGKRSTAPSPDR